MLNEQTGKEDVCVTAVTDQLSVWSAPPNQCKKWGRGGSKERAFQQMQSPSHVTCTLQVLRFPQHPAGQSSSGQRDWNCPSFHTWNMSTESTRCSFKRESDGIFLAPACLSAAPVFLCLYFLKNKRLYLKRKCHFIPFLKETLLMRIITYFENKPNKNGGDYSGIRWDVQCLGMVSGTAHRVGPQSSLLPCVAHTSSTHVPDVLPHVVHVLAQESPPQRSRPWLHLSK